MLAPPQSYTTMLVCPTNLSTTVHQDVFRGSVRCYWGTARLATTGRGRVPVQRDRTPCTPAGVGHGAAGQHPGVVNVVLERATGDVACGSDGCYNGRLRVLVAHDDDHVCPGPPFATSPRHRCCVRPRQLLWPMTTGVLVILRRQHDHVVASPCHGCHNQRRRLL